MALSMARGAGGNRTSDANSEVLMRSYDEFTLLETNVGGQSQSESLADEGVELSSIFDGIWRSWSVWNSWKHLQRHRNTPHCLQNVATYLS